MRRLDERYIQYKWLLDNGSLKKAGVGLLNDRLRDILKGHESLGSRATLPSLINEDEEVILFRIFNLNLT